MLSAATAISAVETGEDELELWLLETDAASGREAGRELLSERLSQRLDCQPQEIAYDRAPCPVCGGPNGRPVLAGPDPALHFSIARSDRFGLVALAPRRVGVDLQARPTTDVSDDVADLLHPAERAELAATPPSARADAFARLWARKEAYLKGLGSGIVHGLDADYLGIGGRATPPAGWRIVDLSAPAGHAAAVAIKHDG